MWLPPGVFSLKLLKSMQNEESTEHRYFRSLALCSFCYCFSRLSKRSQGISELGGVELLSLVLVENVRFEGEEFCD